MKVRIITLARAKGMVTHQNIAVEDFGYFELIKFLAVGQGDAEALDILLANRQSFCRAVTESFDQHIRPVLETLVDTFGWKHDSTNGRLVFVRNDKSHTFYVSEVRQFRTKAQIAKAREANRLERLAAQPKGRIESAPDPHGQKKKSA